MMHTCPEEIERGLTFDTNIFRLGGDTEQFWETVSKAGITLAPGGNSAGHFCPCFLRLRMFPLNFTPAGPVDRMELRFCDHYEHVGDSSEIVDRRYNEFCLRFHCRLPPSPGERISQLGSPVMWRTSRMETLAQREDRHAARESGQVCVTSTNTCACRMDLTAGCQAFWTKMFPRSFVREAAILVQIVEAQYPPADPRDILVKPSTGFPIGRAC